MNPRDPLYGGAPPAGGRLRGIWRSPAASGAAALALILLQRQVFGRALILRPRGSLDSFFLGLAAVVLLAGFHLLLLRSLPGPQARRSLLLTCLWILLAIGPGELLPPGTGSGLLLLPPASWRILWSSWLGWLPEGNAFPLLLLQIPLPLLLLPLIRRAAPGSP